MSRLDDARRALTPRELAARRELGPAALAVLGLAALAVAVGGWEHAYLYHRGYSTIDVIGPSFLVNAVASLVAVLLLLARRPLAFVLLSLAVSVGSLVAIVLTRTTGLFGFEESGYDSRAVLTIVAELSAVVLAATGAVLAARDPRSAAGPADRPGAGPRDASATGDGAVHAGGTAATGSAGESEEAGGATAREGASAGLGRRTAVGLAVAASIVLGTAILGVAPGDGDEDRAAAPGASAGATDAVRVLGATGERGREVFRAEGCAACHRLAEAGASGRIGPDLDGAIADDDAEEIRRAVVDPGPGMPDRFGELPAADLDALVRYLEAAAGGRP